MTKRIASIIIVLSASGLLIAACGAAPAATAPAPASAGTQADIEILLTSAEGNLVPMQSASLSFAASGTVAELWVEEGAKVRAGEVIARLKNDNQQAALAEAQANLAAAQANQAEYRTRLPELIAAAEADLKAAQAQQSGATAARDRQAEIVDAEAALAQAHYMQQQAQTTLDLMYRFELTDSRDFDQVKLAYEHAVNATQAAEARLTALKPGSPGDRAAGAQINAAAASAAAAQARLVQLQAELDGKATDTFEAAIRQAQAAIESAQIALTQTELRAPFDGVVAKLNLKAGELPPSNQPAVVLADLSGWRIETGDVTEIKVPDIRAGQSVTIKLDALPDLALKGVVESIGAVSQIKSGDVVYPVKIEVLGNDPRLRWGMTAAITFEE
jgi:multidrug resistance efflux pump